MGVLYIVGTPIGNLGDISPRALEILENVDFIAAEDTRVTLKLLNHYGIKNTLISYHEHNKVEKGKEIATRILKGENCAIVTDAGMPAISDPGEDLVKLCYEYGIKVESVPGPSALTTALALSGMDTRRFVFEGFLPIDKKEKEKVLSSIKNEERTTVLYEAPHRISKTLKELAENLDDRHIAIVREITKIHEEVIHTNLHEAAEKYQKVELKGELVLIISGAEPKESRISTLEQAVAYASGLVNDGETKTNAAKIVAKETGFKKGEIYSQLIKL